MKSKKASIPVTILVVGTLVLCTVALAAIYITRDNMNKEISSFKPLRALYNAKNDIEFSGLENFDVLSSYYPALREKYSLKIEDSKLVIKTKEFEFKVLI